MAYAILPIQLYININIAVGISIGIGVSIGQLISGKGGRRYVNPLDMIIIMMVSLTLKCEMLMRSCELVRHCFQLRFAGFAHG